MASGIYKIVCSDTGKAYYGSTTNWRIRRTNHRSKLRCNTHENAHLQNAFNKYGAASFAFIWVEDVPVEQLLDVEQIYLDGNKGGFNIAQDAKRSALGRKRSPEECQQISDRQRGKHHSEARKKAIGDGNRGKKHTPEAKARISMSMRGRNVGEKYGASVLREWMIPEIRHLRIAGYSWARLAARFSCSKGAVRHVIAGNTWSNVP